MTQNVGTIDRVIRLVLGLAIIALGFYFGSWWGALGLIFVGTAREVVSRILKDLERGGLIALSRGAVTLLDVDGLDARAVMA